MSDHDAEELRQHFEMMLAALRERIRRINERLARLSSEMHVADGADESTDPSEPT